jgi:hypothetical protein
MGKFIKVTLSEYITERYSKIDELQTLVSNIITLMAKDIASGGTSRHGEYIFKNIFKKIDIEKYHDIKGFIKDNHVKSISVSLIPYQDSEGYYIEKSGEIILNLNPSRIETKTLSSKDEKVIRNLLNRLYFTLIHELQHAYDDYRSNGKYVKGSYNNDVENLEVYYRSNHELNAHFTHIISSIHEFYKIDYELTPTSYDDGVVFIIKKMVDFDIIKKEFIDKFKGWDYLTHDIKNKILNKLGKYYIDINEVIQRYNKEKHTKDFSSVLK